MYEMFSKLSLIPEDTQFTVPKRHVGGLQDLTGQPVSDPAYPSRNAANSSPPLCLLRGEGGSSISTHEEENSSCPVPDPQFSLSQGQACILSLPLTLRLVLAAYKAFVAFIFQQLE